MWHMHRNFSSPVRPVWGDGAAAGSGAVDVVAGCAGKEQGHNQEHPQGSGAPFPPVPKAGWTAEVSLCGSPACQMTERNRKRKTDLKSRVKSIEDMHVQKVVYTDLFYNFS